MTAGGYRGEIVVADANVLFSKTYRDWLCLLYLRSTGSLFDVKWTEDILAEVMYHLRRKHPEISGEAISRLRDKIATTFPRGRVTEYTVPGSYRGPDLADAHVHAAAESCGATIVLTENTSDFVPDTVDADDLPYEVYRPDDFFVLVDDSAPALVRRVALEQVRYFVSRSGEADLPKALISAGAPYFAERVRLHLLAQQDEVFASTTNP